MIWDCTPQCILDKRGSPSHSNLATQVGPCTFCILYIIWGLLSSIQKYSGKWWFPFPEKCSSAGGTSSRVIATLGKHFLGFRGIFSQLSVHCVWVPPFNYLSLFQESCFQSLMLQLAVLGCKIYHSTVLSLFFSTSFWGELVCPRLPLALSPSPSHYPSLTLNCLVLLHIHPPPLPVPGAASS